MEAPKNKLVFNRSIFWDMNFYNLDYDGKASFIMERVFECGNVDDIRQCRWYYEDEKVTDILLNAKFLPERRLHLAAAVIDKSVTEFRCYTLRRLNPAPFPY